MNDIHFLLALFLLINVIGGLVRVARGPTAADRMSAVQLFGTTGVAVLLVLAHALEAPALRDVALVFALLAAVGIVVFVRYSWRQPEPDPGDRR